MIDVETEITPKSPESVRWSIEDWKSTRKGGERNKVSEGRRWKP